MNAILGITRPGDFGADMMHFNPHKTFSGPHGGGGPGAGPIAVRRMLAPYLPAPIVARDDDGASGWTTTARSRSAAVRTFLRQHGRVGPHLLLHPHARPGRPAPRGGKRRAQRQLPAGAGEAFSPGAHGDRCMHEFVASASRLKAERGITAMDVAKRLLDYGFHAPTVYFPLIVKEAMMIEPTETESQGHARRVRRGAVPHHRGTGRSVARSPAHHARQPPRRSRRRPIARLEMEPRAAVAPSGTCGPTPRLRRTVA